MANAKKTKTAKPLGGAVVQEKKTITKKQKIVIIVLACVIAAALVAGIVVLSLALTGNLTKGSEAGVLRSRDADNGFKKFYVEGGEYPGLYAVMTIEAGEEDYDIEILLLPEYAPITVANFRQYAEEGFYDGTVFHRIVDSTHAFQGGGYTYGSKDGDDVPEESRTYEYVVKEATHDAIKGEFKSNGGDAGKYDYNVISHFSGVISMARAGVNTATSGFFLMWENYPAYDGDYAAFGFIVDPEDVRTVKRIALQAMESATETSNGYQYPTDVVTVKKVEIVDKRGE